MAQHMIIADEGERFVIIPSTRKISVPQAYKIIGAVGDHNSEQLTFECPRYVDGHDVSECARHIVLWRNAAGVTGKSELVKAVVEESTVLFTWTISSGVASVAGVVSFSVYFEDVDDADTILYRWSTATCQECQIATSLIDASDNDAIVEILNTDA